MKELDINKFSVLSLNIQSLPAKFAEFSDLISQYPINLCPEIICLEETWKIIDNSFFPLANYHMLETNLCSETRGGGVGIYEKNHLSFKILKHY